MIDRNSTTTALLTTLIGIDPSRPVLTYYDRTTGERTELSGATLGNWVAKTANLLVDGAGLGHGEVAALWLPPHWQTAAVLLGCWSAGLAVAFGPGDDVDPAVAFAGTAMVAEAPTALGPQAAERYVLGLAPMGLPLVDEPAGWNDYIAAVRGHGDHFTGAGPGPNDPAWIWPDEPAVTHDALCAQARQRAAELGIPPEGRVLLNAAAHPNPREWLLAPLAAGASVVLCAAGTDLTSAELEAIADTERAVHLTP